MTQELNKYVQDQLAEGVSREALNKTLVDHGWDQATVNQALMDNAVAATVPMSPVESRARVSGPGGTKKLMAVIGVVVMVGVLAAGGVFGYTKFFSSTPQENIKKMIVAMQDVKPASFVLDLKYSGVGSPLTAVMLASSKNGLGEGLDDGFLSVVDKDTDSVSGLVSEFGIQIKGKSDFSDLENLKSDLVATFDLKTPIQFGPVEVSFRSVDKKNYLKVNELPPLGFFDASKVAGSWISIDEKTLKDQLGGVSSDLFFSELEENKMTGEETVKMSDEKKEKIRSLFFNEDFIKITKVLPMEKIGGVKTHHYAYAVDKTKLVDVLLKIEDIINVNKPKLENDNPFGLVKRDPADYISAVGDIIEFINGEIWIGKKDSLLYKSSVNISIKGYGAKANITMVLERGNFNSPVEVQVPEGVKTVEEILDEVMGESRMQARDAKRMSDLRQIQTALELYYTDNSSYPIQLQVLALGVGQATCMGSSGWGVNCENPYMGIIPTDPKNNYYTYISLDGKSYELRAKLEGEWNGLVGELVASPTGIVDTLGNGETDYYGSFGREGLLPYEDVGDFDDGSLNYAPTKL